MGVPGPRVGDGPRFGDADLHLILPGLGSSHVLPRFESQFCPAGCVTLAKRASSLSHLLVQPCRMRGRRCGPLGDLRCSSSGWLRGGHLLGFASSYLRVQARKQLFRDNCCSVPARPCRRLTLKPAFAPSKHWPHISPQSTEHPSAVCIAAGAPSSSLMPGGPQEAEH